MYGYEEHFEITPEQILQKVTQQQIFEFVLKQPFNFGDRYCSPLREDNKPDCRFEEREDGTILFVDFGEKYLTGNTHRTCFKMVMEAFGFTLINALRKICNEFNLSRDIGSYSVVSTNNVIYNPTGKGERKSTLLTYDSKFPSKSDIIFWSQFLIKLEHLQEDNSYCVRSFTITNDKGYRKINAYKHCYVYDFIDAMKFYQPYSEKYKWITNCDENHIGNIDNLPSIGDELIIQKSYKDHRVLRNLDFGLHVIWFQNEGCVPSLEILNNLTERFKIITVFYDNDKDGVIAGMKLVDILNVIRPGCARMVHLPRKRKHKQLFGEYLKDPAAFINKEGKTDLITALKQIGIYAKNI